MNFLRMFFFTAIVLGSTRCLADPARIMQAVDVIDPISGVHWLRLTDPGHPAAPPRLSPDRESGAAFVSRRGRAKSAPCVRAGDRVLLHRGGEGSALVSVEATALQSGSLGDRVRARIVLTGALVEMEVSGPGAGLLSKEKSLWH